MQYENVKKIGIMSDSHDNLPKIRAAVEFFNHEKVDLVIHAGDLISPFTAKEMKKLSCPFEIILGNNDGEILGLHNVYNGQIHLPPYFLNVNNKKIIVLHDGSILQYVAVLENVDVVIYGHDHEAKVEKMTNNVLLINPGETGGWLKGESTVAIYDLQNNIATIYRL